MKFFDNNSADAIVTKMIELFAKKGYTFFDTGVYNLNIIGVRSNNAEPNRFDDLIVVLYRDDQYNWQVFKAAATTDPGRYWLLNPMRVEGTAILVEGQYRGAYSLGLHKGQYTALVQRNNMVKVYRDRNKNNKLDFGEDTIQEGYFGINIHRASAYNKADDVEKWSAGCQVIQNLDDYDEFINLCSKQISHTGCNTFTYTLINERDLL